MTDDRLVPKVHPLARELAAEDPLELMAQTAIGDPEVMLECILQEFAWMGYGHAELVALFHHPGYPVLGELLAFFGPDEVERRVTNLLARSGQWQFRESVVEPDEGQHELNLIQITTE